MSLLNSKAGVISRQADFLQFDTTLNNTDVLGNQAYGSNTITQKSKGVQYSNVQSAINDIRNFAIRGLNAIEINTDGISPEGEGQQDEWIFTGTVTGEEADGTEILISVYGFPVKVLIGDTDEEVAGKVKTVLEEAITNGEIINSVETSSTSGNILNVKYNDNQVHRLQEYAVAGITISTTELSPAKAGYGAWVRIGTQSVTFDGETEPTLLHYFKRIG
jgi:hypothetical protein